MTRTSRRRPADDVRRWQTGQLLYPASQIVRLEHAIVQRRDAQFAHARRDTQGRAGLLVTHVLAKIRGNRWRRQHPQQRGDGHEDGATRSLTCHTGRLRPAITVAHHHVPSCARHPQDYKDKKKRPPRRAASFALYSGIRYCCLISSNCSTTCGGPSRSSASLSSSPLSRKTNMTCRKSPWLSASLWKLSV